MKDDETRKAYRNNKKEILEKLKESIISKEADGESIEEDLSRNVDSPDDAARLVGRIESTMKSKKKQYFDLGIPPRFNF